MDILTKNTKSELIGILDTLIDPKTTEYTIKHTLKELRKAILEDEKIEVQFIDCSAF